MAEEIKIGTAAEETGTPDVPATEATTSEKEPVIAAAEEKSTPSEDGAIGASGTESAAPKYKRKLPVFRDELESGAVDKDGNPLPTKKKRKLPVFADEVNPFEYDDDEDVDDDDASAFAMPVLHVDARDLKEEAPKRPSGRERRAELIMAHETGLAGGTAPSIVPEGEVYPDPVPVVAPAPAAAPVATTAAPAPVEEAAPAPVAEAPVYVAPADDKKAKKAAKAEKRLDKATAAMDRKSEKKETKKEKKADKKAGKSETDSTVTVVSVEKDERKERPATPTTVFAPAYVPGAITDSGYTEPLSPDQLLAITEKQEMLSIDRAERRRARFEKEDRRIARKEEKEELLETYLEDKEERLAKAKKKADGEDKTETEATETPAAESETTETSAAESETTETPAAESETTETSASKKWVDPGIAEAAALLKDHQRELERRKDRKNGVIDTTEPEESEYDVSEEKFETPKKEEAEDKSADGANKTADDAEDIEIIKYEDEESEDGKWVDPGIAEAAALLAAYEADKEERRELRALRRKKKSDEGEELETAEADSREYQEDSAPVVVAPVVERKETEKAEETVEETEQTSTPAPAKEISTDKYDDSQQDKLDKKQEREALAVVYAVDRAKRLEDKAARKAAKSGSVDTDEITYEDIEAYEEPKAEAPKKAKPEPSTEAYDKALEKKAKKSAEYEALAVVYGEEYAKKVLGEDEEKTETSERVYDDVEAYVAPEKAEAPKKVKPEPSTEAYDKALEKKARKSAEYEALALVYGVEYAKRVLGEDEEKTETPERVYDDVEAYEEPAKEEAEKPAKVKKEVSTEAYDEREQTKSGKKDEREALAAVYTADRQRIKDEKAKKQLDKAIDEQPEVVYGDAEAYEAPTEDKSEKTKKEISTEAYDEAQEKKLLKAEERETLAEVYDAERTKRSDDKASAKYQKLADKEERKEARAEEKLASITEAYEDKSEKTKKEISTEAYDEREQTKSDKKDEREALAAVYAADRQRIKDEKAKKQLDKAIDEQPEVVYGDAEAYEAPTEDKSEKTKKEISTEAYDEREQSKSDKKDEREALAAVYAADRQRIKDEREARKAEKEDERPVKVKREISTEAYDEAQEKKLLKAEERETLAEVYDAERTKRSDDKAIAKYQKLADKEERKEARAEEKLASITEAYDEAQEKKQEKSEERATLLAVASADRDQRREDKALRKEERKAGSKEDSDVVVYADFERLEEAEKVAEDKPVKAGENYDPYDYEAHSRKVSDKKEKKEELVEMDEAERLRLAEAAIARKYERVAAAGAELPMEYPDPEPYEAPEDEKTVVAVKAKRETSTEAYDAHEQKKQDKKDEREALAALAVADRAARSDAKALRKEESKAETEEETVYPDGDYTEGYNPDADREADEAKRAEKADAKADKRDAKKEKKTESAVEAYDAHEQKKQDKKDEREALAALAVADRAARSDAKALRKEESKAKTEEEPVYPDGDYTEGYNPDADREADEAKRAEKAQAKADKRDEKEAKKTESAVEAYDAHEQKKQDKKDEREALAALAVADRAARSDAKALRKEESKAETEEETVYPDGDYTEGYNPDADREADEAKRAEKAQAKADKRDEKEAKKTESAVEAYEAHEQKKQDKKDEREALAALAVADRAARSDAKALRKEESKAETEEETVYPDGDYTEGYNPDADREADEAKRAEKAQAKADKRDEKEAKKTESAVEAYEEKLDKKRHRAEVAAALVAFYNGDKEERKLAKDAAKAEKAEAKKKPEEETVYPDVDYTEGYNPDAEREADEAKRAEKAQAKADKRDEKEAKKTESAVEAYEAHETKKQDKKDERDELLLIYKEENERLAAEKAKKKAEKKAAGEGEEVVYPDFTDGEKYEVYDEATGTVVEGLPVVEPTKREVKLTERAQIAAMREVMAADTYERTLEKKTTAEAKKEDLVKADEAEKAEKRARADLQKADLSGAYRASKARAETQVYPDPESVLDGIDIDMDGALDSGADLVDGAPVTLTADPDYRRIKRENRQLELLIKHGRKRAKKTAEEIETLELADKYSSSGSLGLADQATVVRDAKFYKQEKKDRKAVRAYEEHIAEGDLIDFEREYTISVKNAKKKLKKAKKTGKFSIEYGSTYDPEYDGDFNNYGLPEVDPLTADVKLTTSRRARRQPRRERFAHFDKKRLTTLSNSQCETDNKLVEARVRAEFLALELDVAKSEMQFSGDFETRKEKKWRKESKKKLLTLKTRIASAVKFEKLDNKRYYSVVATNFDNVDLPKSADRDELIVMRDELMRLLDIRDELNVQLLDLYTGTENSMKGSYEGRVRAELRARKRAYRKYRGHFKLISRKRVTRQEKLRIFDKMDEVLDLRGDLARINYILRKEKPAGRLLAKYKKEKRRIKRELRVLRKVIDHISIKALRRAKKRSIRIRNMIISYTLLILLVLGIFAVVTMGPQLLEAIKPYLPENIASLIASLGGGAV